MGRPVQEPATREFEESAHVVNGKGVVFEDVGYTVYGKRGSTKHTIFPVRVPGIDDDFPEQVTVAWQGRHYTARLGFTRQENGAAVPVYNFHTQSRVY